MSRTPDLKRKTICLCMIVKNESHVVARALASARHWIDYWVICDTGSIDHTQDIIQKELRGIPGELHEAPWVNFGHNRTEVVSLARGKSDYILVLDADMILNVSGEFRHGLNADYYEIRYTGNVDYSQNMFFANRFDWKYIGVTHEYLQAEGAANWEFLPALSLTHFGDGASRAEKYQRDIHLLTSALQTEPDNARYKFYLAQSYKDLGLWAEALEWYGRRATHTDAWEEETWYSLFQVADMKRLLHHPWSEVMAAYQQALDERPHRLEPLYAITRHYRESGQYLQGYLYSSFVLQGISYPSRDMLFIEKAVYKYLLLLEHAACALACGRITETINAINLLLLESPLPQQVYQQAIRARSMALNFLYGPAKEDADTKPAGRVVVIVPFHNPGVWLSKCEESLRVQDTNTFRVIFIDDTSHDKARDFVPSENLDAILVRNPGRMGTAYNLHHAITTFCNPDDIVVCLDGDDWLAGPDAISFIQNYYTRYDCWVLYGQYEESDGTPGLSAPFSSPNDFLTLRKKWKTSHIRTFRAGLFQRISEQDSAWSCLKDEEGNWLTAAVDAAIMFPLLEMAGFNRVHFNERVLYIYNIHNPNSHHHVNLSLQQNAFESIRARRPFTSVSSYIPIQMNHLISIN